MRVYAPPYDSYYEFEEETSAVLCGRVTLSNKYLPVNYTKRRLMKGRRLR